MKRVSTNLLKNLDFYNQSYITHKDGQLYTRHYMSIKICSTLPYQVFCVGNSKRCTLQNTLTLFRRTRFLLYGYAEKLFWLAVDLEQTS